MRQDGEVSKAHAFATFADAHDWNAVVRPLIHRDYADKKDPQVGWTVIARRGPDVVTATWID